MGICVLVSPQQILSNCEFGNNMKQVNRRCSKYCLREIAFFKLRVLFENNRSPQIRFVRSDNDVSTSVATVYNNDQFPYRQLISFASTNHKLYQTDRRIETGHPVYSVCFCFSFRCDFCSLVQLSQTYASQESEMRKEILCITHRKENKEE